MLYNVACRALNQWLGFEEQRVGGVKFEERTYRTSQARPVKKKSMVKFNLLTKCAAWLRELKHIHEHEAAGTAPNAGRVACLCQRFWSLPWTDWLPEGTQPPADTSHWHDLVEWFDTQWENVAAVLRFQGRHALAAWRAAIQDAANGVGGKKLSRWLNGAQPVHAVRGENGTVIAAPPRVAEAIKEAWKPILEPEELGEPISDEEFRHMTQHLTAHAWGLEPIDPVVLAHTARTRSASAPGLDQISHAMLSRLPANAFVALAEVLNMVEATGQWPAALCSLLVAPIPKAGEAAVPVPLKVRLISVASQVYRFWATYRVRWARAWLQSVLPPEVCGGVQGKSTKDVMIWEGLRWDISSSDSEPMVCAYLDASKCFDMFDFCDVRCHFEPYGVSPKLFLVLYTIGT